MTTGPTEKLPQYLTPSDLLDIAHQPKKGQLRGLMFKIFTRESKKTEKIFNEVYNAAYKVYKDNSSLSKRDNRSLSKIATKIRSLDAIQIQNLTEGLSKKYHTLNKGYSATGDDKSFLTTAQSVYALAYRYAKDGETKKTLLNEMEKLGIENSEEFQQMCEEKLEEGIMNVRPDKLFQEEEVRVVQQGSMPQKEFPEEIETGASHGKPQGQVAEVQENFQEKDLKVIQISIPQEEFPKEIEIGASYWTPQERVAETHNALGNIAKNTLASEEDIINLVGDLFKITDDLKGFVDSFSRTHTAEDEDVKEVLQYTQTLLKAVDILFLEGCLDKKLEQISSGEKKPLEWESVHQETFNALKNISFKSSPEEMKPIQESLKGIADNMALLATRLFQ